MRELPFFVCGSSRRCPSRTHRSRPVKKNIHGIYFFTCPFEGSAFVAVRASPQKRFSTTCKRVLQASRMRSLLELLLRASPTATYKFPPASVHGQGSVRRHGCERPPSNAIRIHVNNFLNQANKIHANTVDFIQTGRKYLHFEYIFNRKRYRTKIKLVYGRIFILTTLNQTYYIR